MSHAIERDAQTVIDAVRAGYRKARITRTPCHAIADRRPPGYRIVETILPGDSVIAANIVPPRWNVLIADAATAAFDEFHDARAAIDRAADILARSGFPDVSKEEIAEEIMRRYVFHDEAAEAAANDGRYPERKRSIFTRIWGNGS